MEDVAPTAQDDLIEATSDLVAAYVSNNHVQAADVPGLIATIHAALAGLGAPVGDATGPAVERPTPAQIKRSITPDGIVSFLDGKTYKTMKRHLTRHGLTPQGYRERYGLPNDYPTTAASYSEQRSSLAKSLGLGQIRRAAQASAPEPEPAAPEAAPEKPKRAPRVKKAASADA